MEKKDKKYGLLTIKKASKKFGIPEQTLRHWKRQEDSPEMQRRFWMFPPSISIYVNEEELVRVMKEDLEKRLDLAEELAKYLQ